ncbi:hypothetical protein F0562_007666 [Nyssa sinensis]|uniref:Uncharacterized protein n=1 Tax=Nyssa sinensis TaxID=561372 RepID=A0A5J5A927_9ASTE|nr:hypothetical protein F0562_007666 [Nyssa sinensis]
MEVRGWTVVMAAGGDDGRDDGFTGDADLMGVERERDAMDLVVVQVVVREATVMEDDDGGRWLAVVTGVRGGWVMELWDDGDGG